MHHILKATLSLTLLLATQHSAHAQSMADIDKRMSGMLDKITYWDEYRSNDDKISASDSLGDVNDNLTAYLMKVCVKYPKTITAQYPNAIKSGLTVITSDDSKLRCYSWDTRMGGTMRNYSDYIQYQSNTGMHLKCINCDTVEIDFGADYRGVTTLHTQDGKAIYFVTNYAIGSTRDRGESIDAYEIAGSALKPANVFKTKTKTLSSIGYSYDMFASDGTYKDIPTIHFGKDNKRLYIPIVDGEIVTAKYLVYVWDGNQFVFDKDVK